MMEIKSIPAIDRAEEPRYDRSHCILIWLFKFSTKIARLNNFLTMAMNYWSNLGHGWRENTPLTSRKYCLNFISSRSDHEYQAEDGICLIFTRLFHLSHFPCLDITPYRISHGSYFFLTLNYIYIHNNQISWYFFYLPHLSVLVYTENTIFYWRKKETVNGKTIPSLEWNPEGLFA